MLASIHPLGERGRGQNYALTVTSYTVGSSVTAAAFGAVLGLLGRLVLTDADSARAGILAVAAAIAFGVDRTRWTVPSWHRQVNEDWLADFRGWVYGLGFGAQLGLGVVTIVTTASVYLTWIGAFVTAGPVLGAVVGLAFGFARAVPVLTAGSARDPERVSARVRRVHDWAGNFNAVTLTAEATAGAVAVLGLVILR
ncbi:MAG: sulfite exporter TauE/SafE family protein [Acidimicrobiia bacterium]|nr:sulfite exporter TauE/SafE family protein [Acidimicrobiia bacterium]